MKSWVLLLFILLFNFSFSQYEEENLPYFPHDQYSYLGGTKAFYKDIHDLIVNENVSKCEHKNQAFTTRFVVNTNNEAKLDKITSNFPDDKCITELSTKIFPKLDKWVSAKINNVKTEAYARYYFYPDVLFENYKDGYQIEDYLKPATFGKEPNGEINSFRKEVVKRIDLSSYKFAPNSKTTVLIGFTITETGEVEDLIVRKSSGLKEFDDMVINAVKKTIKRNKYTPATLHGIPIRAKFNFPLSVTG